MNHANHFEIEDGVLKKYLGPGGHVAIPDGVTEIGRLAFREHTGVTGITIPDSVKRIRADAFYRCAALGMVRIPGSVVSVDWGAFIHCTALKRVIIEDGVQSIGPEAFSGCSELEDLHVPSSVTKIGAGAFSGCRKLEKDDRLIVGPYFGYYRGDATEFVVPDGINYINTGAFSFCKKLEKVILPEGITEIDDFAFKFCYSLKTVRLPSTLRKLGIASISDNAICHMTVDVSEDIADRLPESKTTFNLLITVVDGNRVIEKYYMTKYDSEHKPTNFPYTSPALNHARYDSFLVNNKGYYKLDGDQKLRASLYRLRYPIGLSDGMRAEHAAFVAKYIDRATAAAQEENDPEMLELLSGLDEFALKKAPADDRPLAVEYARKFKTSGGEAQLAKMGTKGIALPEVRLTSGETAPASVLKYILAEYGRQYVSKSKREFAFSADADAAAALLDRDSLESALEYLRGIIYIPEQPHLLAAYCRFGAEWQIEGLIADIRRWHDWAQFAHAGRYCEKAANDALMLSDTRAAMAYMDKLKRLDEYAALRGTTAGTLRDTVLSDFGLDQDGSKVYDLGDRKVTAVLDGNLNFVFHDSLTRKTTKSMPQGGDAVLSERAAEDLAAMKKNLRGVLKIRTDLLFEDFLSGEERSAESWRSTYLPNPVLRRVAGLVVWSQERCTFTLEEGRAVDCRGNVCDISDAPVSVAHPLEMDAAEVEAWRQFFRIRKLKQLFEQIDEPIIDRETVSPDRYNGRELSVFKLMRQAKHGITFVDEEFHTYIGFELNDCELAFVRTYPYHHEIGADETFRFGKFSFERYTRRVNHIVSLFDKWLAEAEKE